MVARSPRSTGSPPIRIWRTDELGASPINWQVLVHPQTGYLYAANSAGVLEFDGVRWRLIPLPHGVPARTLVVAPDGRLWAAGSGQIAVLEAVNPGTGQLVARDGSHRLPPELLAAAANIASPSVAGEDAPVSGLTTLMGVYPGLFAAPDGVYLRARAHLVRFGPNETASVWGIPESQNRPWWHDGAVHLSGADGRVYRFEQGRAVATPHKMPARVFETLPRDDGSVLWLTSTGLWLARGDEVKPHGSPAALELFARDTAYNAIILPDGSCAFATSRHGLVVFDRAREDFEVIDRRFGLPADRVNAVALDAEGGLWLAMHTGLARVQRDSPFATHGAQQGLSGSPRAFAESGGKIFVASSDGLSVRDRRTGEFAAVAGFSSGVNQVSAVEDGVLASGPGVFFVDASARSAVRLSDGPTRYGVAASRVEPGAAFVGSDLEVGLVRRNHAGSAKPWSLELSFANMPTGANAFFEDGAGFVWMVSRADAKIRRLDWKSGLAAQSAVRTFGAAEGLPEMTAADKVRLLAIGDTFFVVSRRGAWRWEKGRAHFDREPRLMMGAAGPDAIASSEREGWLFFSEPQPRLRRVTLAANGNVVAEDQLEPALDGLIINALHLDHDQQTLWIAGQGQLVSYDLRWRRSTAVPGLDARVRRVLTSEGAPLWAARPFVRPETEAGVSLAPAVRAVRFEFAAPSFQTDLQAKAHVNFRTRALPLDVGWQPWSEEAQRDLTNLPDGELAFELQARDGAGRVSPIRRFTLQVLPPWWRTTAARVTWACLGLAGVGGLVVLRTRTLRQRNQQLEALVASRTAELARLRQIDRDESMAAKMSEERARLEMLRYQLNPHFLYNALNSIRALVFSRPPAAGDMVSQLADFCRVTLTRNEDIAPVSEEFAMLRLYLEMEKTRWREKLDFVLELQPEAAGELIPPFLLLPLVENALKHGWQSATAGLRWRIGARLETTGPERALVLEVANTGEWITPGESHAPSTGIGLENLRRRLQRYHPAAHEFTLAAQDGWVIARVKLTKTNG